jgi:putative Holliday junction resolvase
MTLPENRSFIAVDYGSKRIGLARSDPTGTIASALLTIEVRSRAQALAKLKEVIDEHQPDGLVFGYPLLPSGDKSDKCKEIDAFIELIKESYDNPVYRQDESYTSEEAASVLRLHGKQTGRDKGRIDRLAATVILERFLRERS